MDTSYEEHRLGGSTVRRLAAVGVPTDFHEIQQLPNGHFLLDAYRPRHGVDLRPYGGPASATVYDAEIQEITPSGHRVWRWSSRGHIGLAETQQWWPTLNEIQNRKPAADRAYDVVHLNSIAKDGDGLVISARHTDAVYRIDRATGRVDWKLGGTHTPQSLSIAGDPQYGSTTFGGQHDARVLPDGTLTVHDNGNNRSRPPRVVRYGIDAERGRRRCSSSSPIRTCRSPSGAGARASSPGQLGHLLGREAVRDGDDPLGRPGIPAGAHPQLLVPDLPGAVRNAGRGEAAGSDGRDAPAPLGLVRTRALPDGQ